MKIVEIKMLGNEHGQLAKDTIYAKLQDDSGKVVISATLDYVLRAIIDRGHSVDGVSIVHEQLRGAECSRAVLDLYH